MNFNPADSISKSSLILDLVAQKQKLLGTNIANVDTVGYKRKTMDFSQVLGTLDSGLETKMAAKLGSTISPASDTGEAVHLPTELTEMQNNSLLYSMATRRLSNVITQMKTVLNVGK